MATTYKCEKCGKENLIDLFEDTFWDSKEYKRQPIIYYEYMCECKKKASLQLRMEWGETKQGISLKKWDIINIEYDPDIPKHDPNSRNIMFYGVKGDAPEGGMFDMNNKNKLTPKHQYNNMDADEMGEERILSAIWMGLTKLSLPQEMKFEIMDLIHEKLDEFDEIQDEGEEE